MKKMIITISAILGISIIAVGSYMFLYVDAEPETTSSNEVNIANMYTIPKSNDLQASQTIILNDSGETKSNSGNNSINKKNLTTEEIKSNIVKGAFITTSKDIATF